MIPIDYDLKAETLYIHATRCLIASEQSLEAIGSIAPSNINLPSWVPDFSRRSSVILNPLTGNYRVSGDMPLEVDFLHIDEDHCDVLAVHGIRFDVVASVLNEPVTIENVQSLALES